MERASSNSNARVMKKFTQLNITPNYYYNSLKILTQKMYWKHTVLKLYCTNHSILDGTTLGTRAHKFNEA